MRWKALAAACLLVATSVPASAKDKVEVVVSSYGYLYLTVLTGAAMGLYEQEGLDLGITRTAGGSKALAAVVSGDAQVFLGPPSSALRAREKGVDVAVYGAGITQYASNIVISKKWADEKKVTASSSYKDKLQALKGATFAVTSIGSGTDQLVHFLAKEAGINPERDMRISGLGTAENMLAAMSQDRIQGFTHSPPESNNAVKDLGAVMLFNNARGEVEPLDGFLYIAMISRESWVKSNPQVAERFLRGMQRTLDAINDPATTAKARDATHAKWHSKTEKAFYDEVWESTRPAFPKTIAITPEMGERVEAFINEFEREPLDKAKIAGAFDGGPAEKALADMKKTN